MHSLRSKVTTQVLLLTALAVLVVTTLSVMFIRNAERGQSDQLLRLLCETGERNLDYYFRSVEQSVNRIVNHVTLDLDGTEDEKLQAHIVRVQPYFEEIANKTNGVLTYYYRIDPAVSETVQGFWYINMEGKDFAERTVTDITQYDTNDTTQLVWFTVPKAEGKAVWLSPYNTDNLDARVISYNTPIYWRGTFVGVIGIEISNTTVKDQVESIKLYNGGYAFLTDEKGNLIFHPRIDTEKMNEEERPKAPEGLASESTFITYTYEGVEKEAAWLRLSNRMRLYVTVPVKETEGDWEALVRQVLIAAAFVLVFSMLLAQFSTGRITKPLKQLTEAAEEANRGNYDFTLEYDGKDEVGTLTKTFRNMAEHVKAHISDLNKRAYVDALTSVRNKGAFTAYIGEMEEKIDRGAEGKDFAIGILDCNDLKTVNDGYGHEKGDIYLKTACRLICKTFQHSPVFRIGGDEFAVILKGDDFRNRETLTAAFEQSMAEISAAAKNKWEEVHIAMGIAEYDPEQDSTIQDTIRRADEAMYTKKRQGKISC